MKKRIARMIVSAARIIGLVTAVIYVATLCWLASTVSAKAIMLAVGFIVILGSCAAIVIWADAEGGGK